MGSVRPTSGATDAQRWPSLSRKLLYLGIVLASADSEPGRYGAANPEDPSSPKRSEILSAGCAGRIRLGCPRIHGELLKLASTSLRVSVSKYMPRCHELPSQTWRTFLENHVQRLIDREPIFRWGTTHRSRERFSRRNGAVVAVPQVGGLPESLRASSDPHHAMRRPQTLDPCNLRPNHLSCRSGFNSQTQSPPHAG